MKLPSMKRTLITSIILCLCQFIDAQQAVIMKYHVSHLKMGSCYPTDSVAVDQTQLIVNYRYSYIVPSAVDTIQWTDIRMAVGKKRVMQQDMYLYYDRVRAFADKAHKRHLNDLRDRSGTGPSNLFVDLFYNKKDKTMQVVCGDYIDTDAGKKYVQPLPDLQWEMLSEQDTIGGYVCYAAHTDYGGRRWNVWYTMDIPMQAGPWKLNGLPGLILKAVDDAGHKFEVMEIRQEKVPMYQYGYRLHDLKTVDKFLRFERNFHEHPYDILGNGGEVYIVTLDKNGENITHGKEWTIPYNPIELE